ncbi:hypothetical protein [Oribacterium sp.]
MHKHYSGHHAKQHTSREYIRSYRLCIKGGDYGHKEYKVNAG